MGTDACVHQLEPWFVSLAILGALYVAASAYRLLCVSGLAFCLRGAKDLRRRYGAWALVTGPTSSIGRSMALELARRGEEAMGRLREAVEGLEVGVLVNNAGLATPHAAYLHEVDVEAWVKMIRVNLWAVTEVTAAVLPGMVERGRGAVVNIGSGSTEALPSYPLYSVYAATKRYVAQFSRSLYVEYRGKGIDVQCQAPLYVDTKMVTNMVTGGGLFSWLTMPTSDAYAEAAARWIGHRYPICMPNLSHRLQWCFVHFIPDRFIVAHRLCETLQQRAVFQRLRSSAEGGNRRTPLAAASTPMKLANWHELCVGTA